MKKVICSFLFLLFSFSFVQSQETLSKRINPIPFSIYGTDDFSVDFPTLLKSNPTFVPVDSYTDEFDHRKTYWLKLDFTQALDTLKTKKSWKLRTSWFEFAVLYSRNDTRINATPFGAYNGLENRTSVDYNLGITFDTSSLIDGFLYIKFRGANKPYNLKRVQAGYTSMDINELYTGYYSVAQVQKHFYDYVFMGICLIIFVCFCFIYAYTLRKEFLYYSLYVLFSFLYLVSWYIPFEGYIAFNDNQVVAWLYQISQIFINLFYCLFIVHYLNTMEKYPKLDNILKKVVYILLLVIVLDVFAKIFDSYTLDDYLLNFERLLMTAFGIFGMVFLLIKSKNKLPYFIVLGSLLYMIGAWAFFFSQKSIFMIFGVTLEIVVFTLGLSFKIHLQHKEKLALQKEISEKEISALRAQMNPHFIFNSLNSIQHLILKGDKIGALKYLTQFGKLTRNVLDNSVETKVSLADEINLLHSYLELESLRFDRTFSYTLEVDELLDLDSIEVPLLLVQPFVENSIIHGLMPKQLGHKQLTIRFKRDEANLICEVEDNGVGRAASQFLKRDLGSIRQSRGMKITERRLELIKTSKVDNANIDIHDKYDNNGNASGTKVIIKILAA